MTFTRNRAIFALWAAMALSFAAEAAYVKGTKNLNATTDFKSITDGKAPFYKDTKHRALAINAANPAYRGVWARAETTFTGQSGTYDITITTLGELDGECPYRILVNGVEVGTVTNPVTEKDCEPMLNAWKGVKLRGGDQLAVESKAVTNGKVPERGGTAWARGRWRGLKLVPSK